MNVRQGLLRLSIVAAIAYWGAAAYDANSAFQSASADVGDESFVLRGDHGAFASIAPPPGGGTIAGCKVAVAEQAPALSAQFAENFAPSECERSATNKAALRDRNGRRAAVKQLRDYAIGFGSLAAVLATIAWIGAGFMSTPRKVS